MDYTGKKLLILAGAGPHTKVVESAKEMGIYTIVADYLPASEYSPAKLVADESLMNNIFDVDELALLSASFSPCLYAVSLIARVTNNSITFNHSSPPIRLF